MSDLYSIIKKAEDSIENAIYNLDGHFYSATVNRCYYALYYCINALLLTKGVSPKSHKGAHVKFNELFILSGDLSKDMNTILVSTFNQRQIGDYDIDAEIFYEEAFETLTNSRFFVETAIRYLKDRGYLNEE